MFLWTSGAEAVGDAPAPSNSLAVPDAPAAPRPQTLRIWTAGVRSPVDLPWKPEGYNTRWLHDFLCGIHGVRGAGHFLPTTGAAGDSVLHLLFVPRIHGPAGAQPRFWLFHVEDRASVVYGHHPFDWDIAATHLQELYHGVVVPRSRPTLVIGSQLVVPSCHLTDVPSGSIVQIPLGALPMEASNDVWDPTPWVVPGPFFQYVPARGPAGEEAISPALEEGPDRALQAPPTRSVACQTNSSYSVDHRHLSAPVVENLVLQLQGVADCLLSLPFSELAADNAPPSPLASSSAVPVFSGPPVANSSVEEVSYAGLGVAQGAESPSATGDVSSAASPLFFRPSFLPSWSILGVGFLGSRDSGNMIMWVLGVVLSLDPVRGSFFSPNASGSEEDVEPAEAPQGAPPWRRAPFPAGRTTSSCPSWCC